MTADSVSPPTAPQLHTSFNVEVAMRDGAILRCNVTRPVGEGRWPVILMRTPYDKDGWVVSATMDILQIARSGYVVIVQDTRGRFASDGEFQPFVDDGRDGADTIEWAAAQPYASGDVFLFGYSYCAFTQWAAAVERPPALRAFAPFVPIGSPWRSFIFRGGAFELGTLALWFMIVGQDRLTRRYRDEADHRTAALVALGEAIGALDRDGYSALPLERFEPLAQLGLETEFSDLVLSREDGISPLASGLAAAQACQLVEVPALIVTGWYDVFASGALDQYVAMRSSAGSSAARTGTRLIVGPWNHQMGGNIIGERNFGLAAAPSAVNGVGLGTCAVNFFNSHIQGTPAGEQPVRLFVMGVNQWRDEAEWPLAREQATSYYLHSGAPAKLSLEPGKTPPSRYDYDPADPAPTHGGSGIGLAELAGPRDQRLIEGRDDILVFTSEALPAPLEVTGIPIAEIWAASTAEDTDFVVRLIDVAPDGTAYNISEGIVRARYRENPDEPGQARPLVPGEPTLFRIELTPTSNVFKSGHRLRVHVTSSNFPRWDRNLNIMSRDGATLADAIVAQQTIFHSAVHSSRVILPVIPLPAEGD